MSMDILQKIFDAQIPDEKDLEAVLHWEQPADLERLYAFADKVRKEFVGDGVLLRGIVEISNECQNTCRYCGLNKNNAALHRYSMTEGEIIAACRGVYQHGIKTIVIQSGESSKIAPQVIADAIATIKREAPDEAITLSLGEYPREVYALWRAAGADRYLLKQEVCDPQVYKALHPEMSFDNRMRCLRDLRELGYQVGSGIIIGIPGQTPSVIARDIRFFAEFGFEMIGIGPFIAHQETDLRDLPQGDVRMVLKAVALTRIVTKDAHIPATTSLGSVKEGDLRLSALKGGANVLMPNFTPNTYKAKYEIYPNKRCIDEPTGACALCMEGLVASVGRFVLNERGDSPRMNAR
jgi:biotin synthase